MDEQYLAVILAQVSTKQHLADKLEPGGSVDRAFAAAPALEDRIVASLSVDAQGRVCIEPDQHRMANVITKIAFGLYSLHYGPTRQTNAFQALWIGPQGAEPPPSFIAAQFNWPGLRRKTWTTVQKHVFSFLFSKGWMVSDPPLYCLMNFHDTIHAAVACPSPIGSRRERRLRSAPWRKKPDR